MKAKPKTHPSVFLADSSRVLGDVTIGEDSSVWYSAVIRGDLNKVTIGKGTNIQDNVSVHVDPKTPVKIGDHVSVGHNAVIHGCTIHSNCIIGIGAIILNGAVVGSNSIVGAGAVVKESQKIPTNSLAVGVPAKVIRTLTPEHKKRIQQNAKDYINLAKKYK